MLSRSNLPLFRPTALIAFLAVALMCAGVLIQPPLVRTVNKPSEFDANLARQILTRILGDQKPHPIDNAAHDLVRSRIMAEIKNLGVEPQVQDVFTCKPHTWAPAVECGRIQNIVFSLGPQSGPAILAATHYDSVPAGPGASDAGIAIAAWLETARILSREKLTRRVIFLISDGEESGLLGANAFAQQNPLMQSVQSIVNLDARGTCGPALFFETKRPNAKAVSAFSAGARRPLANSIMADVYRLLPNLTDVTVLTRDGLDVVNIALLDGVENYHTPRDSLAFVNLRSVQHMGDLALGVTRAFAAQSEEKARASLAFMDIASRVFIAIPEWTGRLGLILGALAGAWFFWRQNPRGRWPAFGAPILALTVALAFSFCIGVALAVLRADDYWFAYPAATRAWCVLASLFGVAASLLTVTRFCSAVQIQAAAMLWYALIGLAGSIFLPGLSILFLFPTLIFGIGVLAALRWGRAFNAAVILAALAALIIWAPLTYLVEAALGFEFPAAISGLIALMLLPWMGGLAKVSEATSQRSPAALTGAGALFFAGVAAFLPAASDARPQPLNISYFADASTKEARFLVGSAQRALPRAIAATGDFQPKRAAPGDWQTPWNAPAPYQAMPAPVLRIVSDQTTHAGRIVRARLEMNGVYRVSVRIPRAAIPTHAMVNGVDGFFGKSERLGDYVSLGCQGRSCDGADIAFYVGAGAKPREWLVVGQSPGAPAIARPLQEKRPKWATPIQFGDSVTTITRPQS